MNATKDFIIGILTYIQYDHLDDLLEDINRQTIWPKEVIISDNGIGYVLKKKYKFLITIVKNSYNFGTCRGLNQIVKLCNNKENILFMCDDNFFVKNNSMELIYNIFEEQSKNNIHIIWLSHWASFFASKKWIEDFGLWDEHLWPCYYEDSDAVEKIRKNTNSKILCSGVGYPVITNNEGITLSEYIGNRHATCSRITNVQYNDTVFRTCSYYMNKWKNIDTINNDEIIAIHDNTKNYYMSNDDVDFYKCHVDFLKNIIKNYNIVNSHNQISNFVDEILNLKTYNFKKIIEYKTQRAYVSQLLLHLQPEEFISYDDQFLFNHDFCYHLNYLMNYNITIKLLNINNVISEEQCDLLVINFNCNYEDVIRNIQSQYILIFNNSILCIDGYEKIKETEFHDKKMTFYKKL